MTWLAFGSGLILGIAIGMFVLEFLHFAGLRERKKLRFDRQLR